MISTPAMRIAYHKLNPSLFLDQLQHFALEDVRYVAAPIAQSANNTGLPSNTALVTIVPLPKGQTANSRWLDNFVQDALKGDDVFRTEFLAGVVFAVDDQEIDLPEATKSLQKRFGTSFCHSLSAKSFGQKVPYGPHLLLGGQLYKAYRLYDDQNEAFMMATKPYINAGPFKNLRISGDFLQSLSVAVPSRKPASLENPLPLAGLRYAVKDLFEIEGLRYTAGCRAFYDLSQLAAATAPILRKLNEAGAYLLGTLKLGSLIAKEEPTEAADYHAPFNPRADGYQSAWSSSGGSGAAIASYDWIDFTIGTDTTGSGRRPAMANGCFQIRLTQGLLSLDHSLPSFSRFDSPCLFARNLSMFEKVVGAWADIKPDNYDNLPISLLYLKDYLPLSNTNQTNLIDKFLLDSKSTFGVEIEKVSIAEQWEANPPAEASGASWSEYFKDIGVTTFCYGVYHVMDQFRADYHAKYHKKPYVNPSTSWRWDAAQNVTQAQHEDGMNRLNVYKAWFLREILQVGKRNTLLVLPITTQVPDYRDVPPSAPGPPDGSDAIWIAPILGAPEVSIPVGELKYDSRVSGREEFLPVVVALMGAPGTDMALLDAARQILKSSGRPDKVFTGARMFQE